MRSINELIENNIDRTEMTEEEGKIFLNYWYTRYETEGFVDVFDSPFDLYPEQAAHKGMKYSVISRCEADEKHDIETLPMWKIRFEDGFEMEAYPEEITLIEKNNN